MKQHAWALALIAVCSNAFADGLKDELRQPWQRGSTDFTRHWLAIGPFDCDLPTDCVKGEAALKPVRGATIARADGSSVTWGPIDSWGDSNTFGGATGAQSIYASTTIHRDKAGPARLSLGTVDGVRVWVNGRLVHARDGRRDLGPDEDTLDVELEAGDNLVILKVAGASAWTLRVLAPGAIVARAAEISPSVIEMQPELFTVRTDATPARADADAVTVVVFAPGGVEKFSGTARRGELVGVDAKGWPDGPYDVQVSTLNARGLRYTTWRAWYKGNALVEARELAKTAATIDASQPAGFTFKMLVALVDERLGVKLADAKGNPWPRLHSTLMEYEELMLERAGKGGRVHAGGFVRLAWGDDTDGTPQYCRAYLPPDWTAAKKWPVLLQLHGFNPQNPQYVGWWGVDERHSGAETEFSGHRNFIYVEPHGRGNTQYRSLGDADVLRCLAEAKRLLSVDDDRVYLSGESMGGAGTWNVATRHPDVFAAIAPVFGGVDYHSQLTEEQIAKLSPVEKYLQERDSNWALAESLNNLPVFVHQGDSDKAVNVEWSRWGVRLLQRFGYDVRYQEHPGRGHEVLTDNNPFMSAEFFLAHVRNPDPRQVRIHSPELRNAKAYWVDVRQRERPLEFMSVDAEVIDRNVIRLDTENVAEVVLTPAALVDATRPVTVVWNGVARELKLGSEGLRLSSPNYSPGKLHKSPELPGGINDIFNTPFALVVGTTSKDARMRAACRRAADSFIASWTQWQKYPPRVFLDTEIADADIARYSLLLVGGADANRVTAKLAAGLPLRLSGDTVTIDGHAFRAPDAGVQLLYPNPRNAARYVWLFASTRADALGYVTPNPSNVAEWDYLIDDGRAPARGTQASIERMRVVSGSFDQNWRFASQFATAGDIRLRSEGRYFAMPSGAQPDAKLLAQIAGKYQVQSGPLADIHMKDGVLVASVPGTDAVLEFVEGRTFYAAAFGMWVSFDEQGGKITGFKSWNGQDYEAVRTE
jgi:dienelactone hydrolase